MKNTKKYKETQKKRSGLKKKALQQPHKTWLIEKEKAAQKPHNKSWLDGLAGLPRLQWQWQDIKDIRMFIKS